MLISRIRQERIIRVSTLRNVHEVDMTIIAEAPGITGHADDGRHKEDGYDQKCDFVPDLFHREAS